MDIHRLDNGRVPMDAQAPELISCAESSDQSAGAAHAGAMSPQPPRLRTRMETALGNAISGGQTEEVRRLVEQHPQQARQPFLLTLAARLGRQKIVDLLLEAGNLPTANTLLRAVENHHFSMARQLLAAGAPRQQSLFELDDLEAAQFALDAGLMPDAANVARAILAGHTGIVEAYLDHGLYLHGEVITNAIDRAVTAGHAELLALLLNKGFHPNENTVRTIRQRSLPEIRDVWNAHVANKNAEAGSLSQLLKPAQAFFPGARVDGKRLAGKTERTGLKLDISAQAQRDARMAAAQQFAGATEPVLRPSPGKENPT